MLQDSTSLVWQLLPPLLFSVPSAVPPSPLSLRGPEQLKLGWTSLLFCYFEPCDSDRGQWSCCPLTALPLFSQQSPPFSTSVFLKKVGLFLAHNQLWPPLYLLVKMLKCFSQLYKRSVFFSGFYLVLKNVCFFPLTFVANNFQYCVLQGCGPDPCNML